VLVAHGLQLLSQPLLVVRAGRSRHQDASPSTCSLVELSYAEAVRDTLAGHAASADKQSKGC
jgi:hypothetical protein